MKKENWLCKLGIHRWQFLEERKEYYASSLIDDGRGKQCGVGNIWIEVFKCKRCSRERTLI